MYTNFIESKNLFFSGFNFETLSDFSRLNRLKNSENVAQHFSLMANALNIRDTNAKSADIYDKYDVRTLITIILSTRYLFIIIMSVSTYDSESLKLNFPLSSF